MARPTDDIIVWANQDIDLPSTGRPNKSKPIDDLIGKGFDKGQKPAAEEFNYLLNLTTEWVDWIVNEKFPELEDDITRRLDELETRLKGEISDLKDYVNSKVDELKREIQDVQDAVDQLREDTDEKVDDINDTLSRMGNLQVSQVTIPTGGSVTLTVPTECAQLLIMGYYTADGVESRDYWESKLSLDGGVINTTQFYGYVTGSKGHGHHRREILPFSQLVDMQLAAGNTIEFKYDSNRGGNTSTFTVLYLKGLNTPSPDEPTAVVITPSNATIQAGAQQQFVATVLPATVAADYPVSWSVADPSLGSIDSNGLYTALPGVSGTQSVIGSVSTGLASTSTITQHTYLTNITIGAVPPGLLADRTYTIPVSYSPAGYTESVVTSSTDSTIATLSASGQLVITAPGTVTLTLTGASSGVSASVTITATEEVIPEMYLKIANNFSEIAAAGETAKGSARENIGVSYTISTSPPPTGSGYAVGHVWYQVEE